MRKFAPRSTRRVWGISCNTTGAGQTSSTKLRAISAGSRSLRVRTCLHGGFMNKYVLLFSGGAGGGSLMRGMQKYREEQGATPLEPPEVAFVNRRWTGRMRVEQEADPVGLALDVKWERFGD